MNEIHDPSQLKNYSGDFGGGVLLSPL